MLLKKLLVFCLLAGFVSAFPVIHVIGDSHCREFIGIENTVPHHIGPITMHRVGRDGIAALDFRVYQVQENDIVILSFGEIDVRCHIGKQRDLKNRELEEVIDTLLYQYLQTVRQCRSFYENIEVILYTVTPPTDQIDNPEFPKYGSIEDRIFISKLFNRKLEKMCSSNGLKLLDVYDDYADETGALNVILSDANVHISENRALRERLNMLIPNLKRTLKRRSAIEPWIGHMKHDGKLDRCYLKGPVGDQVHALLVGIAHNFRTILRKLRLFCPYFLARVLCWLGLWKSSKGHYLMSKFLPI